MNLSEKVMESLKEAMKSKDKDRMRGLRAIKAAILLANTDGSGKELDSEREVQLLQKLIKQRKESMTIYQTQGRDDLAAVEQVEIDVIQEFLPKQMDETALRGFLQELIRQVGATSVKDMGKVMGLASKQLAGKAENATISRIIKEILT